MERVGQARGTRRYERSAMCPDCPLLNRNCLIGDVNQRGGDDDECSAKSAP
jgi:hypothetical protein